MSVRPLGAAAGGGLDQALRRVVSDRAGVVPREVQRVRQERDVGDEAAAAVRAGVWKAFYLSHGCYLASSAVPLIDEVIEAWPYGPVAPTIYHDFKHLGNKPILNGEKALRMFFDETEHDADELDSEYPTVPPRDALAAAVIKFVLDTYGEKSGIYLSNLTYKIGSPWDATRSAHPNRRNVAIPDSQIATYFQPLLS